MKRFIARYRSVITGVLSGFDRLVFRGTIRRIAYADGLGKFLNWRGVLLKDFSTFAEGATAQVRAASETVARRSGRPIVYLPSSRTDKEKVALEIAEQDSIREGLIAVLECVEPCLTFGIHRDRERKQLQLVPQTRKCLFVYHYWIDPTFGLMNARIQTWLPFNIQVCLNGREWLAREMDRRGLGYRRWDNCFLELDDVEQAQRLMNAQLRVNWTQVLDRIALQLNPEHPTLFDDDHAAYYWSVYQSEWASDVMFRSRAALNEIYPALVLHGISTFSSADVMRFLGRRIRNDFSGQIVSDFKDRVEGVRIKHRIDANSLKLYDKYSILRAESTINDPAAFRVFRPKQGGPKDDLAWRPMRQGIADLHRRAQVSHGANDRYLAAFAQVDTATPIGDLVGRMCKPILWNGRRSRALKPWAEPDLPLLRAISRGEFHLGGFRNRDLQALLYKRPPADPAEQRRRSARVSRHLRLLRAHGLIKKIPRTHRYCLTELGQRLAAAVSAVQRATLQQLQKAAA